jgi:hypothetical protein
MFSKLRLGNIITTGLLISDKIYSIFWKVKVTKNMHIVYENKKNYFNNMLKGYWFEGGKFLKESFMAILEKSRLIIIHVYLYDL